MDIDSIVPRLQLAACTALLGALARAAEAAPLVVVKSDDPLLPPGMVIDSEAIKLAAGKSLSVITPSGQRLKLKGPAQGATGLPGGSAGPGDANRVAALSSLLASNSGRTSTVGVIRNAPKGRAPAYAPEAAALSVAAAGPQCLAGDGPYSLWRPAGQAVQQVEISAGGGTAVTLAMGDAQKVPLPTALALTDGARLNLRVDGGPAFAVEILLLPGESGDPLDRVVWMSSNRCAAQAKLLLERILGDDPAE